MTNDPYQQQPQEQQGGWQPVDTSAQQGFDQGQQQYQPSANQPYPQPSASQPFDQTQAPYGQQSATPGWENTGAIPQGSFNGSYATGPQGQGHDEYTGVVPGMSGMNRPTAPQGPKAPSPIIGALTDFGFKKFGTHSLASLAYIAVVATAVIGWIADILRAFGVGNKYVEGDTMAGLGALLLGWIPVLATIVVARILLEVAVSIVDDHTGKGGQSA